MISCLCGNIIDAKNDLIVLDVNGVGYDIQVSPRTNEIISRKSGNVSMYTYLHVREDALVLYGFANKDDRELFLLLLKINGVGPKLALSIQNMVELAQFQKKVIQGDTAYFEAIPGIGNRMANRIIVELKGKIDLEKLAHAKHLPDEVSVSRDAVMALIALGYPRLQAEKMIESIAKKHGTELSVEEFLKHALNKAVIK